MTAVGDNAIQHAWYRSERVFLSEGGWFFHTREGVDLGPYDSPFEAEVEAALLKERLTDRGSGLSVINQFVKESHSLGRPLTPLYDSASPHR